MKMIAAPTNLKPRHFIIKHDDLVGFYLYVYENGRCVRDHLQDTLDLAIELALKDYLVPKESWKRVD
jgi:hypothetical protein